MVQVLFDPVHSPTGSLPREDNVQITKDMAAKRAVRPPRRGWSMTDYQTGSEHTLAHPRRTAVQETSLGAVSEVSSGTATPVSDTSLSQVLTQAMIDQAIISKPTAIPVRPKLPPPRRSYSVQDYEPIPPNQPKPSAHMNILDLPSELHYALFDFLDPIDGICLGLAHSRLHDIAKRKYGKVCLSSRYEGPNDMEWAWRGAGPLVRSNSSNLVNEREKEQRMRPKGQVYCRKCGTQRCELHRHLKEWMGEEGDVEYCAIKKCFSKVPGEDKKAFCNMSSPKDRTRCGRHGPRQLAARA